MVFLVRMPIVGLWGGMDGSDPILLEDRVLQWTPCIAVCDTVAKPLLR